MKKNVLFLLIVATFFSLKGFSQKVIPVTAGTDVISAAYDEAAAGDIIELVTDGGAYEELNDFVIEKGKPITIRAAEGLVSKPRWFASGGWALIQPADGLTLRGIILDGTIGGGAREVIIRGAEPEWNELQLDANLKLYNCDFINAGYAIYGESRNQIDTVIISRCTFKGILQTAVQLSGGTIVPGQVKHFLCENSTFWNIGGYALYLQSTSLDVSPQTQFLVDHVTIHNAKNGNIYPNNIDGAIIKNSIITSSDASPDNACVIFGTGSQVKNVLYYNLNEISLLGDATSSQLQNIQANVDPNYASAASGNFTLMSNSQAINAGDDGKSLGDPRWWPENNSEFVFVSAGENNISQALASSVDGQTILLVTNGGIYNETSTLIIDKDIVIKVAEGLSQRPTITSGSANAMFEISADFLLKGVILDGAQGGTSTAIGITNKPNTSGYKLTVLDSDFLNFADEAKSKGFGIFGDPSSVIDSVFIQDCYFAHILDMGISFNDPLTPTGSVNHFMVDNSTFWDMNSEAIYVDGNDSNITTKDPQFNVNKVTVYDCGSYNIIAHYIDSAVISNSLVVLPTLNTSYAPAKIYGTNSKIENFLYFNTRDIDLSSGATDFQLTKLVIQQDPLFTDPEAGLLFYPVKSPAVLFTDDGGVNRLGDDRWWPTISFPSNIHWGTTRNSLNGLTITWANQTENDSLRWGYTPDYEMGTFPGIRRDNYKLGENKEYLFDYRFPKLKPSSKIYYSLKFSQLWGGQKIYTTSVDTTSSKFTFVAGADQQNGKDKWKKMSSMAAAENADFYCMVGDIIDNSLYPSLWEDYYDYGADYLEKSLTYYAHGNHVYYDTESGMATFNQLVLPGNESWYSFKQGNTLFIFLNTNASLSTQWTYIKNLLQTTTATWKVVCLHAPFFTSGGHAGEMDAAIPYWWKAFDDYGVDVLINGHEHTYSRSKPINLNVSNMAPVAEYGSSPAQGRLQMQAGSMGGPLYGDEIGWWVGSMKSTFCYVKFQVDGDMMHFDAIDENGAIFDSLTLHAEGTTFTGVEEGRNAIQNKYQIQQNYPNPFNSSTKITYNIPVSGKVVLKVYDVFGNEVKTLINGEKKAGNYDVEFNGASLESGIYYCKIKAGSYTETRKMVLLK